MQSNVRAGVVGLGQMGRGIAANLDALGLLSAAWDANPAAIAACPLSSAVAHAGAGDLGACDVVLLVVPGSAEITALLDTTDALLAGRPGRVFIDLTTSHPGDTARLAARAAEAGAHYLDAGMSGGAAGASARRLTLMIGGDAEPLEYARPVLDAIAAHVLHVGPSGAGHTMKLVHNMICHTNFLATVEGCRAAEQAGIPLATAIEVINAGNARSFVSERRFPDHILTGTFDGRSHVGNLAKDLRMAADLFEHLGRPGRYADLTASLLTAAEALGLGSDDFTTLFPRYEALVQASGQEEAGTPDGRPPSQVRRS